MDSQNIELSPLALLRKRVYDSRKAGVSYETICKLEGIPIERAKILTAAHSKTCSGKKLIQVLAKKLQCHH